ncbi:uncharacterized protein LOC118269678 [Spodoptera frugiperda]|uniref:Regulatory protein zeste n=1 Tax=Spodoptera frugiperda TaxID=7108 RepID=A0A9R0D5F0_SPOFR|nr:uncharacterized protein LOC118269678 [Spodoptera frugiperda]XP_035440822.2 uncharacterized protein LOC118269678 [Spodoptera frugiperda]XP_050555083.1 uncharacterized protein LOC118269678 [Spodoptera frugiperda]
MSDVSEDEAGDSGSPVREVRASRPSLAQLMEIISFMEEHPDLARRRKNAGLKIQAKHKKLWTKLAKLVNSVDGPKKTKPAWIKFWSDKRRSLILKQKQIEQGKLKSRLTPLQRKILVLCDYKFAQTGKFRGSVRRAPVNGDTFDDASKDGQYLTAAEQRQMKMINQLIDVMDEQSAAMTQLSEATLASSKALEQIADASYEQALAVDRVAGTFEGINASVNDIRNALLGIDYTMKRCYPATQQRQNIFS